MFKIHIFSGVTWSDNLLATCSISSLAAMDWPHHGA